MPNNLKILAYDIETKPLMAHAWGIWQQNIGLNQLLETVSVMSVAARWVGTPKKSIMFFSDYHDGHSTMVKKVHALFDEADAVMGWNSRSFDDKHMQREFLLEGLNPPSPVKSIDLMVATKAKFKFVSNKLDHVSQQLGVGSKVKHEGFGLWIACMNGDPKAWERMKKYNEMDVHLLLDLYDKLLPWISNHPNISAYGGQGCAKCGSADLEKRGFSRTATGIYQRFQCRKCGGWSKSGKSVERFDTRADQ